MQKIILKNTQYIKDYDTQTFQKIIQIHNKENFKFNLLKVFNKKLYKNIAKFNNSPIENMYKTGIVSKVLQFANIDLDEYLKYTFRDKNIKRMNSQEETDAFWYGNIKEKWLCMNIDLQLKDYSNIFNEILNIIEQNHMENISLCDYGCGSAALSMALNNRVHFNKLDLYDIDNYVAKYVQYAIKENNLSDANWYNIIDEHIDKEYDFVVSLDVLEHIEKSFDMLKRLTEKTKKGGYLVLKIAFECNDPTHLPQAAKNFFIENDGMKYLRDNFKLIKRFQRTTIVNGIYQKL